MFSIQQILNFVFVEAFDIYEMVGALCPKHCFVQS